MLDGAVSLPLHGTRKVRLRHANISDEAFPICDPTRDETPLCRTRSFTGEGVLRKIPFYAPVAAKFGRHAQ
jgi:hypothetical protein